MVNTEYLSKIVAMNGRRATKEKPERACLTRSQRDRKRCYHAPCFAHGIGQRSNSNGYTGAQNTKHPRHPKEICLALFNCILCRDLCKCDEFIFQFMLANKCFPKYLEQKQFQVLISLTRTNLFGCLWYCQDHLTATLKMFNLPHFTDHPK